MFKRFAIFRDPDASDASGGSVQVSAPSTAPAQSDVAVPASPAAQGQDAAKTTSYGSDYFLELESKSAEELGDLAPDILDAYTEWVDSGRKMTQATEVKPKTDKADTTSTDASKTAPNTDEGVRKLVEEKPSNKWTDEETKAVVAAMEKVGAKTPTELLQKTSGALQLAGRKGQEAGELQAEVLAYRQLFTDLQQGRPEAIEFLQKEYGMTLAQAKAAQAQAQSEGAKPAATATTEDPPAGVVDEVLYREFQKLQAAWEADRKELTELKSTLTGMRETVQQEQARVQQEMEANAVREQYIEQFLQLAQEDPDTYGVTSGNLRKLLNDYYYRNVRDPRIENHLKLAKVAVENQLPSLSIAHLLTQKESLSQKLIEAEKRGRESVLNQGRSQGLSSVRSAAGGGDSQQKYSLADIQAMGEGRMDPPPEWFDQMGILDPKKVPQEYHKAVFGY